MSYESFLEKKTQEGADHGFPPTCVPDALFPFQRSLLEWACRKGRAEIMADCGMGKTPIQLAWAENMARATDKPVLVLTPLAVAPQTVREGVKFGVEVTRSTDGKPHRITVTNYERLAHFSPSDFGAVACDEASILKSFDGVRRQEITDFMRKVPYRLLATATAAPNDYVELGTSSEALGYLGHMDMLNRFFRNDTNTTSERRHYGEAPKWRFKGHSQAPFWRWVASWARACRKPSDLGFDDGPFVLPELVENTHVVQAKTRAPGLLFDVAGATLPEQREARKRTVRERCEKVAELVRHDQPALVWCHLNDEGDLLEELIPGAVQVSGADSDDEKEAKFLAFSEGRARVLITKPKIGAWGLNWQHCAHVTFFPSHSYEQFYQAIRRCWRFGQTRRVVVDVVLTEGDGLVMDNQRRKSAAADRMFASLVEEMNNAVTVDRAAYGTKKARVPAWL